MSKLTQRPPTKPGRQLSWLHPTTSSQSLRHRKMFLFLAQSITGPSLPQLPQQLTLLSSSSQTRPTALNSFLLSISLNLHSQTSPRSGMKVATLELESRAVHTLRLVWAMRTWKLASFPIPMPSPAFAKSSRSKIQLVFGLTSHQSHGLIQALLAIFSRLKALWLILTPQLSLELPTTWEWRFGLLISYASCLWPAQIPWLHPLLRQSTFATFKTQH